MAQIGINFLPEVPGKVSQTFTGFHSRTSKHDLVNYPSVMGGYSQSNSKVGFPCTCSTYSKTNIIFPGNLQISLLSGCTSLNYIIFCIKDYRIEFFAAYNFLPLYCQIKNCLYI